MNAQPLPTPAVETSKAHMLALQLVSEHLEQARKHRKQQKTTTSKRKNERMNEHVKAPRLEVPGLAFQGMKHDRSRRTSIVAVIGQFVGSCLAHHQLPVFVDVHAGSGYVSHNLRNLYPELVIITNDFDDNRGTRYKNSPNTEALRQRILSQFHGHVDHPTTEQIQQLHDMLSDELARNEYLDVLTFSRWLVPGVFSRLNSDMSNIGHIKPSKRKIPVARLLNYFEGCHVLPQRMKDASDYLTFPHIVEEYATIHRDELLQQIPEKQRETLKASPFRFFYFLDPPYCSTNCRDYNSETMAGIEATTNNWKAITENIQDFAYFNSETVREQLTRDVENIKVLKFATKAGYGFTRDFMAYRINY